MGMIIADKLVKKLEIKSIVETSMLDWDGKIVSFVCVGGCNFRCPFCQNSGLVLHPNDYETIPFENIKKVLQKHEGWIDGICLSGGEPCIYKDVQDFIRKVKDLGALVKLDTNGAFPLVLQDMISQGIIDYIAMDIKAPLEREAYCKAAGIDDNTIVEKIKASIKLIMDAGIEYEFRTTVVPGLHTLQDIEKIAQCIKGARQYTLQNFVAQDTLDKSYMDIKPYTKEQLDEICLKVSHYVDKCHCPR